MQPKSKVTHLGDGGYLTIHPEVSPSEFMLTANHHDPHMATDIIYLGPREVQNIISFLESHGYTFSHKDPT